MYLLYVILTTLCVALLSMVGILLMKTFSKKFERMIITLVALSAGAMLGNAMFHLFPEALEEGTGAGMSILGVLAIATAAFVLSFLFEQVFRWHHCHSSAHHGEEHPAFHCHVDVLPTAHLILWSDAIHNFVDGLIIGASFLVSPVLGFTTAAAVALHEVPQEVGDFAVLVHSGFNKKRAILLNFLSASTVIAGGVIGYLLSNTIGQVIPFLLPFAAGSFLYIAASDLLPELKHDEDVRETALHFFVFLLGLLLMLAFALTE